MCSSISDRLVYNVGTGEVKQQDELKRITGELRSRSQTVTLPLSVEIEILKAILTCVLFSAPEWSPDVCFHLFITRIHAQQMSPVLAEIPKTFLK